MIYDFLIFNKLRELSTQFQVIYKVIYPTQNFLSFKTFVPAIMKKVFWFFLSEKLLLLIRFFI